MAKKEISLLPRKSALQSFVNKLVKWVLSKGRYIVIFTELIVFGAFLSRFWLDRKNSDLSEKLRQQRAILNSTQTFEREFRLFQSRLEEISNEFNKKHQPIDPLLVISKSMPLDVLLSDFKFSESKKGVQVNLKTQIFSEAGLAKFIDQLMAQEEISSVRIGTIEKEEGKGGMSIQFLVKFNYTNENNKKS